MSNPPKQRGTAAETATERYVNGRLGAGAAQRVALKGNSDQGDLHIWSGRIVVEVKRDAVAKVVLNNCAKVDPDTARNFERLGQSILKKSDDHLEGARAFVEKRPPVFTGR